MTRQNTEIQNWYHTHSHHLRTHPSFEYVGTPEHGINHLIYHQLSSLQAPVWFEVNSKIAHDPVLTANALVEAFNKASGERVLDHGMHYPYVLNIIKRYTPLFGQHTFIFSGTDLAPDFARALLDLQTEGHHIILIGEKRLSNLPLLTSEDLRLTRPEASHLAEPFKLTEMQIRTAYDSTGGVFEKFWIRLHELVQRPIPLRPTAEGFRHPPGHEVDLEARVLASLLHKKSRSLEALEVAVVGCPEMVPGLVEQAGTKALLTGVHEHLHAMLESLPQSIKQDEVVMRWRIEAACLSNKKQEIKAEVLDYLEKHEAPDVRAVSVIYLLKDKDIAKEVDRCLSDRISIHTLKAKTLLLSYTKDAIFENSQIPFEALSYAEEQNNLLEIIRCSRFVAMYCHTTYRYKEAQHWTQFSLDHAASVQNINAIDHIHIINLWVHLRIISNRLDGIEYIIDQGKKILPDLSDGLRQYFENTIANYNLKLGKYEIAIKFWEDVWSTSDRMYKSFYALEYVRCLMLMDNFEKANEISEVALTYSNGLHEAYGVHAKIARAYVLALINPQEAIPILDEIDDVMEKNFHTSVYLMTTLLRKICSHESDEKSMTFNKNFERILSAIPREIIEYNLGIKQFISKFYCIPQDTRLTMRFMGMQEISLGEQKIKLPLRQMEILLILSLNPSGIKGEKLMLDIYGEDDNDNYGSLKTNISKMRKYIPISSNPYKIDLSYDCDVCEIIKNINSGNVGRIVELYKGPLLPESQCLFIEDLRRYIDESVKNMTIVDGNVDYLLHLQEFLDEDLELIESILKVMSKSDPRRVGLVMKLKKLLH